MDKKEVNLEELRKKHESDLTAKERRLLERYTFREMNLRQKLRYFWDYYKWLILVTILVIAAVHEGIGIYHRSKQIHLLSMAVMDSPLDAYQDASRFCEDIKEYLGTGNPLEIVDMDTSVSSGEDGNSVMKRAVVIAAGLTDVMFVNQDYLMELEEQQGLTDWKSILGEDYGSFRDLFDENGRLDVSTTSVWKSYSITNYEPVYLVVLSGATHLDSIAKLPGFFLESGETDSTSS